MKKILILPEKYVTIKGQKQHNASAAAIRVFGGGLSQGEDIMVNAVYPIIGNESWLPFYLTGIGVCEPEYNVSRRSGLVSHQILFTGSGKGVLTVGGNSYIQTENSIFYLAPGVAHEYCPLGGNWTTCWVVFRGGELGTLMRSMGFGGYATAEGNIEPLRRIFSQLFTAAEDSVYDAEQCSRLVYELVLAARAVLVHDFQTSLRSRNLLQNALDYIDAHFFEDISLERLAELSNVSKQHFCRVFRSRMNMRPMEYIARRRIAEARLLLCNTSDSIASVGARCGYPDPAYFGMVFRRYEGISPSEYRSRRGSEII